MLWVNEYRPVSFFSWPRTMNDHDVYVFNTLKYNLMGQNKNGWNGKWKMVKVEYGHKV